MSTQVAFVPSRVSAISKPVSSITTPTGPSKVPLKLSRFRQAPRKPEIEVDKAQLKKQLTPLQYKVTQEKFTERFASLTYLSYRLTDGAHQAAGN